MPDAAGLELAGSAAERALAAAAHPTVVQLMGTGPFDALARVHWRYYPPQRGDLARWGERLAAGAAFDFKACLILALRQGALAGVQLVPPAMQPGTRPG